ncbi:MAG: DUF2892 domain-containing protein [Bacteroidota bacterium]
MKTNMGTLDRLLRFIGAAIIIGLYFGDVISGTLATVLLVLSGILILVGAVGFCPWYLPFGLNTKPKK